MKALAIIPARSNSTRLPHKNVQPILGKPLVQHAIDHAFSAKGVAHVLVTTDSRSVYHIAQQLICPVHWRHADLCTSAADMMDVVRDAVCVQMAENGDFDVIVLLQPTSPMRTASDVDTALNVLEGSGSFDAVISVTNEPALDVFTADMEPVLPGRLTLVPNGAIFAIKRAAFEAGRTWWDKPAGYYMPPSRSIDIDTMADLMEARRLMGETK